MFDVHFLLKLQLDNEGAKNHRQSLDANDPWADFNPPRKPTVDSSSDSDSGTVSETLYNAIRKAY